VVGFAPAWYLAKETGSAIILSRAMLNSVVAKDMQGHVFSTISSVASAMVLLGLALAGPIADRFGIRVIYLVAGTVLLLTKPLGLLSRSQRDYEK
jgi:MFS family permease